MSSGVLDGLELFPQSRSGLTHATRFFALVDSQNQLSDSLHIPYFHSPPSRLVRPKPDPMINDHIRFLQLLRETVHILLAPNVEKNLVRLGKTIIRALDGQAAFVERLG